MNAAATDHEADSLLRDEVRRVLQREAPAERLRELLETPGSFDRHLWSIAVSQGWQAVPFAEAQGGLGLGWAGLSQIVGCLGEVTASLPLVANYAIGYALSLANNAAELEVHATALAEGRSIGALLFAEGDEAGVAASPGVKFAQGLLNGTKSACAFGAVADWGLVSATSRGRTVLVLVDMQRGGVAREAVPALDNARALATIRFTDAPAVELDLADAAASLLDVAAHAAVMTAFEQVGGAEACLKLAREYALQRVAFGAPIGRFQAIKHKLADMYAAVEIARGCAIEALGEIQTGALSLVAAAGARLAASRAYDFAARETIQVHGGIGISWDALPHHHYRRARTLALELGGSPFWRDLLVDALTKTKVV